eukprot:6290981-Amphidinium_carterae.1
MVRPNPDSCIGEAALMTRWKQTCSSCQGFKLQAVLAADDSLTLLDGFLLGINWSYRPYAALQYNDPL